MTASKRFGERLLEGLREALAWKRGELALPVRTYRRAGDGGAAETDHLLRSPRNAARLRKSIKPAKGGDRG